MVSGFFKLSDYFGSSLGIQNEYINGFLAILFILVVITVSYMTVCCLIAVCMFAKRAVRYDQLSDAPLSGHQ